MKWIPILTEADAHALTEKFGYFHDGCLREFYLWTETSVAADLRMTCPGHMDSHNKFLFQRQFPNPSAIELHFDEVIGFHYAPSPENYDSIIFEAKITQTNGLFYWKEEGFDKSWVCGKKLKWRDASEWMGNQLRLGVDGVN